MNYILDQHRPVMDSPWGRGTISRWNLEGIDSKTWRYLARSGTAFAITSEHEKDQFPQIINMVGGRL